jgi:copper chaperone CopZ
MTGDMPVLETIRLSVTGMTCGGCENAVKRALMKLKGVREVSASHIESTVVVLRDGGDVSTDAIRKQIETLGYRVTDVRA